MSTSSSKPSELSTSRTEAARAASRTHSTKFDAGSCEELGKNSIRCIEDHGYDRSAPECKVHFEAYRECRSKENAARRAQPKSLF